LNFSKSVRNETVKLYIFKYSVVGHAVRKAIRSPKPKKPLGSSKEKEEKEGKKLKC